MVDRRHLGGHLFKTHVDFGALDFYCSKYGVPNSFIDVGCGPGGMLKMVRDRKVGCVLGIEGDPALEAVHKRDRLPVVHHDFTEGPVNLFQEFDLGWSVEFVEHVEARYVQNFMPVLAKCRHVIMTHALPHAPGYHHVNCREQGYWTDIFEAFGLEYSEEDTHQLRKASTMQKGFMQKTGMFFRRA